MTSREFEAGYEYARGAFWALLPRAGLVFMFLYLALGSIERISEWGLWSGEW